MRLSVVFVILIIYFSNSIQAASIDEDTWDLELSQLLGTRYAPYSSDFELIKDRMKQFSKKDRYWRKRDEIRSDRLEDDLPLSGLHLVLDPGHIGGEWAAHESRNFRISDADYWVREGELVLEVALMVCAQLRELGAEVSLTRESRSPVNKKKPYQYLKAASAKVDPPEDASIDAQIDYEKMLQATAISLAIVNGDLNERVRIINDVIQPDAVISLHINAAPWPTSVEGEGPSVRRLVDSNHSHVLIFGCVSDSEMRADRHLEQTWIKLTNGSGAEEIRLGNHLAESLTRATELPASQYTGRNAVTLTPGRPDLWVRNLMLLRAVECPVVLLEPYIANSRSVYARIQKALSIRDSGDMIPHDDILSEYADAVVRGLLETYK